MNRVHWLEGKLEEASRLLADSEALLMTDPENVIRRLAVDSFRSHVSELKHDLYLAKSERAKELISIRLIGPNLATGAIPLHLLSRVAGYFERAMGYASFRLQHGKEVVGKIPEELQRLLDLRLADVAFGSTELVITGNVTPDLAGDSLLESSLNLTFELLTSEDAQLGERAAAAGPKASRMVSLLLGEFERERCGVEMRWTDTADREHRWVAEPSRVTVIRQRLADLAASPPENVRVSGSVELLSSTGRIVIRPHDGGNKISARFPKDLYARVQVLHLGDSAHFELILNRLFNQNTQEEVQTYTLTNFSTNASLSNEGSSPQA